MTGGTAANRASLAPTYPVCGVPIAALTPEGARDLIVDQSLTGHGLSVHLCNAYTLSLVASDEALRLALEDADLNLPDGVPVAWMGRSHGVDGPVRGPALMPAVVERGVERGLEHYLYGGHEGVAGRVAAVLTERYPGARFTGIETPPMHDLSDLDVVELADRVNASGAHIIWIAIGTPRQDHLVHRLAPLVRGSVIPVGAAFGYVSGDTAEAPRILRGSGTEWIFRLVREPRRLAKRYLVGNPRFALAAFRQRRES